MQNEDDVGEILLCGISTDADEWGKSQNNGRRHAMGGGEEWPHFARNEIGINHGRFSLIIIKLDHARRKGMGGQSPPEQIQRGNCIFSYAARKFRALVAEEIAIISRASLEVSAEKSSRSE